MNPLRLKLKVYGGRLTSTELLGNSSVKVVWNFTFSHKIILQVVQTIDIIRKYIEEQETPKK